METWEQWRSYTRCCPLVWEDSKRTVSPGQIHSPASLANEIIPTFNSPDLSVNASCWSSSQETNFQYWEDSPGFILFLNNGILFPYPLTQIYVTQSWLSICTKLKWIPRAKKKTQKYLARIEFREHCQRTEWWACTVFHNFS